MSGPVQTCNGIALPLPLHLQINKILYHLPARHEAKRGSEKCEFETRRATVNEVANDWFHV